MLYHFPLTISASTPSTSPTSSLVHLDHGIITRVEVDFPPGCKIIRLDPGEARPSGAQLLVGFRIFYGEHQLFPSNPGEWFLADNYAISWQEHYPLKQPPYDLTLEGYNDDDTYPHTVITRIELTPVEVAEAGLAEAGIIRRLGSLLFGGRR